MSYGVIIPVISIREPSIPNLDLLKVKETLGSLRERPPEGLAKLKDHLIKIHERSHFYDIISTPIGFCIFLLDQMRIFSSLRLFQSLKQYPIAHPIKLPLPEHILSLNIVDPTLKRAANDAVRLRNAAKFLKSIYYEGYDKAKIRAVPKNHIAIYQAASIIPIFNRHFFYPIITEDYLEVFNNFPVNSNEIIEVMAAYSEFNFLDSIGYPENQDELGRILRIFPRKRIASQLFSQFSSLRVLEKTQLYRFILWKSLLGLVCVPRGIDHGVSPMMSPTLPLHMQHPSHRLQRLWNVLVEGSIQVPQFWPMLSSSDDIFEFDEELSKKAGVETISENREYYELFKNKNSTPQMNVAEESVNRLIQPFYDHFGKIFFTIWDNIDIFLHFLIPGFSIFIEENVRANELSKLMEKIIPFTLSTPENLIAWEESEFELTLKEVQTLHCLLALELDSLEPLGLFDQYVADWTNPANLEKDKNLHLKNEICNTLSGYKFTDIEWQNRIKVPNEGLFKF